MRFFKKRVSVKKLTAILADYLKKCERENLAFYEKDYEDWKEISTGKLDSIKHELWLLMLLIVETSLLHLNEDYEKTQLIMKQFMKELKNYLDLHIYQPIYTVWLPMEFVLPDMFKEGHPDYHDFYKYYSILAGKIFGLQYSCNWDLVNSTRSLFEIRMRECVEFLSNYKIRV